MDDYTVPPQIAQRMSPADRAAARVSPIDALDAVNRQIHHDMQTAIDAVRKTNARLAAAVRRKDDDAA